MRFNIFEFLVSRYIITFETLGFDSKDLMQLCVFGLVSWNEVAHEFVKIDDKVFFCYDLAAFSIHRVETDFCSEGISFPCKISDARR